MIFVRQRTILMVVIPGSNSRIGNGILAVIILNGLRAHTRVFLLQF